MTTERRAYVLACDEVLFSITGKAYLNGVYTGDITIPGDELILGQLVFFFTAETRKENPFRKVILKTFLPDGTSSELEIPISTLPQPLNPNRPKMMLRAPLLVQQVVLRPGKIETKVITESEELDAGGIWVTSVAKSPSLM
jgi:hypothetical protein